MKKIIMTLTIVSMGFMVYAQKMKERKVPTAVVSEFRALYAAAQSVKWEKEDGNYEATFDWNLREQSVVLDSAGKILETEVEITADKLPAVVKDYIQKNYATAKIKEAAQITDAAGMVIYEAEVKRQDLLFDANGKFIKAVKD